MFRTGRNTSVLSVLAILISLFLATPRGFAEDASLFELAETVTQQAISGESVNTADFRDKAQEAIDFMRPGGLFEDAEILSVTGWSREVADTLANHLWDLYEEDMDELGRFWVSNLIRDWSSMGGKVAFLAWSIDVDGESHPFNSVAVFDAAGNLLFDTVLVHTVTEVEEHEAFDDVSAALMGGGAAVSSTDSEKVSGSETLKNFAGSVKLNYTVSLGAEVAPYITTATNDAAMSMTASISTSRTSKKGIPPIANPQVYFGTGGKYKILYSSAEKTPYKSTLTVNGRGDTFQDGNYSLTGKDTSGFKVTAGVSVKGVGVSIDMPSGGPMILQGTSDPAKITLGNVLYSDNAGLRYRGTFRSGGSFKLSNFLIRTSGETGETGSVSGSITAYKAHEGLGVLKLLGKSIGTLSPRVSYVRGDHLNQPTFTMTADRDEVNVGEEVTVTVTVRNRSGAVELKDGTVALDTGALNGVFFPVSATVQSYGKIAPNRSQNISFTLIAETPGRVNLQSAVDGRWGSPVPPSVTFGSPVSGAAPLSAVIPAGGTGEGEFELSKGIAKLGKTDSWSFKSRCYYDPGFDSYDGDLSEFRFECDGAQYFDVNNPNTTVKQKIDKKSGAAVVLTFIDAARNKLVLDLRKKRMKLALKQAEGMDPADGVSLGIELGTKRAVLAAEATISGKKQNKAKFAPAVGAVLKARGDEGGEVGVLPVPRPRPIR